VDILSIDSEPEEPTNNFHRYFYVCSFFERTYKRLIHFYFIFQLNVLLAVLSPTES
jgi:hypothetical protein